MAKTSDYGNDVVSRWDAREHREAKTALQLLREQSRNKAARPYRAATMAEAERLHVAMKNQGREAPAILRNEKLTRRK